MSAGIGYLFIILWGSLNHNLTLRLNFDGPVVTLTQVVVTQILEDIGMLTKNREMVSSAFYIHQKYVVALEMEAKKRGKTASRYLEEILEMEISEEALIDAVRECGEKRQRIPELITAKEYAKKNGRSVEQIKVYCRNGRIPGAYKHERDWVIPSSAPYPEDRRKKK